MEGKMTLEEGLATGIVITAEQADTVIEALGILRNHADGVRNSGRPHAGEAADIIAQKLIPVGELLLMMYETGMVAPREMPDADTKEIMDLLYPDPWGQAAQKE